MIKIKNQNDYNHFSNNYKHFSRLNQDLFRKILKISISKNLKREKIEPRGFFPSPVTPDSFKIQEKCSSGSLHLQQRHIPLQDKGCCGVLQERKRGGSVPSGSKKERRKS